MDFVLWLDLVNLPYRSLGILIHTLMGCTASGGPRVADNDLVACHGDGIPTADIPRRQCLGVLVCPIRVCMWHQDVPAPLGVLNHLEALFLLVNAIETQDTDMGSEPVEILDEPGWRCTCRPTREFVRLSRRQPALGVECGRAGQLSWRRDIPPSERLDASSPWRFSFL